MADHVAGWCVVHDDQWPTDNSCCFGAQDGRSCQWRPLAAYAEPCEHSSMTGVDFLDPDDPVKLWRCDVCGWVGTRRPQR